VSFSKIVVANPFDRDLVSFSKIVVANPFDRDFL